MLGAPITDATFIMDEPSSGLHPEDIDLLQRSLKRLRDTGNNIIVVEHNAQILSQCDHLIELEPGAGVNGGKILFEGKPEMLLRKNTPTAESIKSGIKLKNSKADFKGKLNVTEGKTNNLKDISVSFPTKALTVISGVAGSGKSSLAIELKKQNPEVTIIDQVPLAGNSRASILTTLKLVDPIRKKFAKISGLDQSWFSSNGKGACPMCGGKGVIRLDMAFMEDVEMVCEQCGGEKFNDTALSFKLQYKNKEFSIGDVLKANLEDVKEIFTDEDSVYRVLCLLQDVGLGYLKLGQTLDTLSGGELQRIKLVSFLKNYQQNSHEVLILDEVTTGLHPHNVDELILFFQKLIFQGLTLIIINHNLNLIANADYSIDMGLGAGKDGGKIIFTGTPYELANCSHSKTGKWLRIMMNNNRKADF